MDRDLTIMIYGAIMGVVGSILTSIITTIFQFWLARREDERRQSEERSRQLVNPGSAHRDKRKFRGYEEGVCQNQNEYEDNIESDRAR